MHHQLSLSFGLAMQDSQRVGLISISAATDGA
jgi:hypothetical protein